MSSQPKEGWTRDIDFTDYSAPLSHSGIEISLLLMFLLHFYSITPLEMDPNFQKYSWVSNRNIFTSKDPTFPPQLPLGRYRCFHVFFPFDTTLISCKERAFARVNSSIPSNYGNGYYLKGLNETLTSQRISFYLPRHEAKSNMWTMKYFWKRARFGVWHKGQCL